MLTSSAASRCPPGSYMSIPQANKTLQGLAIESLAVYASLCSYFLVLAPNVPTQWRDLRTSRVGAELSCNRAHCGQAVHRDTMKQCDTYTYSRRGWW